MGDARLAPEIMEKARPCHGKEELEALAREEGTELNDEMLEGIAGGYEDPRRPCPDKRDDPKDW